ncbi:hypothetical protein ACFL3M_00880 [Patescibacteria group bacterium]
MFNRFCRMMLFAMVSLKVIFVIVIVAVLEIEDHLIFTMAQISGFLLFSVFNFLESYFRKINDSLGVVELRIILTAMIVAVGSMTMNTFGFIFGFNGEVLRIAFGMFFVSGVAGFIVGRKISAPYVEIAS